MSESSVAADALLQIIEDAVTRRVLAKIDVQAPVSSSPWRTTEEAADYLRCSPGRVYDLVQLGRLRVHKDGRRSLYHVDDLDTVVE